MIPLMKSAFLDELETKEALAEFIRAAPRLSMGEQCAEFEREFAHYQEAGDAVLFNSGGSANLAMLQALRNLDRLKAGAKVGFSALTWSTNVMPILQLGMVPVPIDVETATLNVMSTQLRERLEDVELDALFITNALGFAGDLGEIRRICDDAGVLLIEDNCEALGTALPEGRAGNFGVMGSFSFFVAHHMSTIEGGMVCTDDEDLGEMLRIVRANGWDRNLTSQQQRKWRRRFDIRSELEAKYTFYDLGFNFRPTEITGFLGRVQLTMLPDNVTVREHNYELLAEVARENADFVPLDRSHLEVLSSFAFPVVCQSPELRTTYAAQLAGAGVEIRPMIAGDIQQQPFYVKYVDQRFSLPNTEKIHTNGLYFGNYPELTEADLEVLKSCLMRY